MKSIWKDLLFLHGHVADPRILEPVAVQAPEPQPAKVVALPQGSSARPAAIAGTEPMAWRDCA